jgi:HSP20 family molecular chaperone IbpA
MYTEKATTTDVPVKVRKVNTLLDEMAQLEQRLRQRAYEIFESRGASHGSDFDDWLGAEHELARKPAMELTEKSGHLVMEMALPGLDARDVDVRVTPERLLVRGKFRHGHSAMRGTVYVHELEDGELFRAVDLPKRIDAEHVTADFRQGLLRVVAPVTSA